MKCDSRAFCMTTIHPNYLFATCFPLISEAPHDHHTGCVSCPVTVWRRTGENKRGTVCWKKRECEMSAESEGETNLFHSCKRCACNVKSLHPSWFAKTEAVWKDGYLQLGSNLPTVILAHYIWAEEILFWDETGAGSQRLHRQTWRQCLSSEHRFLCLDPSVFFYHYNDSSKKINTNRNLAIFSLPQGITLGKLHDT